MCSGYERANRVTIANRDITVVVQGPVQALPDREMEEGITARCLGSVRRHLPGAKIVLSTWPGQSLDGLDYDELRIGEDPGPTIIEEHRSDGRPEANNINLNRQLVSTREGLKRATTRYAMKLRSDNFLIGDAFKHLQQAFPMRVASFRFLDERVVVANTFTHNFSKGMPVVFFPCDFFYFGLTRDLLRLWDLPLFEDQMLQSAPPPPGLPLSAEQLLWLAALQKFDPEIRLDHLHHYTRELRRISDLCYANNLVVGDPDRIGLGLCERFMIKHTSKAWRSRAAVVSHGDWLRLYRRHCAPGFVIPDHERRQLRRLRIFRLLLGHGSLSPYRWLRGKLRAWKRARRLRRMLRRDRE